VIFARFGRDVRSQIGRRLPDRIDIGRGPRGAHGVRQARAAAAGIHLSAHERKLDVAFVLPVEQIAEIVSFDFVDHRARRAFEQHRQGLRDHLEVRELLGRDVEQHVATRHVALRPALREIAHRRRQLAVRAAELVEQQLCEKRIGAVDAHGVLHALVV